MKTKNYLEKIHNRINSYLLNKRFAKKESSDLQLLEQMFASLDRDLVASKRRLVDKHNHYITNVSIGNSAASIEAASLLDVIARSNEVQRILDLGSGFSSYIFRKYKKDASFPVEVWSVDTDAMWLKKTAQYLRENDLDVSNLIHWDEFTEKFEGKFDLIFVDMRPVNARVEWAEKLQEVLTENGLMLIDDVHKDHLLSPLLKIYKDRMDELLNLKKITTDNFGRYALLTLPKS